MPIFLTDRLLYNSGDGSFLEGDLRPRKGEYSWSYAKPRGKPTEGRILPRIAEIPKGLSVAQAVWQVERQLAL